MRQTLDAWVIAADDKGRAPESAVMYDSDMAAYLKGQKNPEQNAILRRNIATMKQWEREGR